MTARRAMVLLVLAAAFAAPVCVPAAAFFGCSAVMVAAGWEWDERRAGDARRRNHARRVR